MELTNDRTRMRPKSMESPPIHRYRDMKHTPTKGELLDVTTLIHGRRHRSLNCFEEPSRVNILQELESNLRMEKQTLHIQEIQNDDSIAGYIICYHTIVCTNVSLELYNLPWNMKILLYIQLNM